MLRFYRLFDSFATKLSLHTLPKGFVINVLMNAYSIPSDSSYGQFNLLATNRHQSVLQEQFDSFLTKDTRALL
jgi:hypothetical protein